MYMYKKQWKKKKTKNFSAVQNVCSRGTSRLTNEVSPTPTPCNAGADIKF